MAKKIGTGLESKGKVKNIAYGVSDYAVFQTEQDYYVDKTHFIPLFEKTRYPFFIRPRRMGKSLWLSVLEYYYDIAEKQRFDALFGNTWIGRNPTDERNRYLIMSFDFSAVNPALDQVEESFNFSGGNVVHAFLDKYRSYFTASLIDLVHSRTALSDKLDVLLIHCRQHGLALYILIDEYDNFANTILSTVGTGAYQNLTHGAGFYRHFFNKLKAGSGKGNAPVVRLFITGVSPVTMDDVTSGFNIGDNISLSPAFQELPGFTESEVLDMLNYYKDAGELVGEVDDHIKVMREWYNHYRFSSQVNTAVYNTDMVLYYVKTVLRDRRAPEILIDHNIRIDYNKLRHLLLVNEKGRGKTLNGNFDLLREITCEEKIAVPVAQSFPLEQITAPENFVSLLFYFGLLTCSEENYRGKSLLRIPNLTVKTLMYGYLRDALQDNDVFSVKVWRLSQLVEEMAFAGQWRDVFDFLSAMIAQQTAVRDYLNAEKSIQSFLLAYLNINDFFITHSEIELNKGYCDILLEPFLAKYPSIPNVYLIELKYIARSKNSDIALREAIDEARRQAVEQLNRYSQDGAFLRRNQGLTIHKLVLVFHGWELVLCESY